MRIVARALGVGVFVAGCQGGAGPPPTAPLEIKPMPSGSALPSEPPDSTPNRPHASGNCGQTTKPGDDAPPLHVAPLAPSRVTVVLFWATWCGPCSQQFPAYQKVYAKLHERGLDLVAVSVDDESNGVKELATQWGATFPVAWDEGHKESECWKLERMPTTYVIDRSGVVRFVHDGYHDGDADLIEREVEGLL